MYFCLPDEDLVRDSIPLEEIIAVEVMGNGKQVQISERKFESAPSLHGNREASLVNHLHQNDATVTSHESFLIRTVENGYNSGRTYYIKLHTKDELDSSISMIKALVNSARKKAEVASRFNTAKLIARAVYESTTFQVLSGFLIILVIHICIYSGALQIGIFHIFSDNCDWARTLPSASPKLS